MSVNPENLLAHADFVRYLAYSLILDEDQAEDVVQQTFLAALEKPPQTRETVKSWLGSVTRNIACSIIRSDKTRTESEAGSAKRGFVPSPEDVLVREADRKRVVDAVLSLDPKYRDPILLRYYENLAPREIAGRLGLPVETVRTQMRRGLVLMREQLDGEYGKSRKAWCLALAPIAGIRLSDMAAGVSATAAPVTTGALAPGTKLLVGLSAIVVIAVTTIVSWQLLFSGGTSRESNFSRVSELDSSRRRGESLINAEIADAPETLLEERVREALTSTALILTGKVTDMQTGEPVPIYDFEMERIDLALGRLWYSDTEMVLQEIVQDDAGRYTFHLARAGYYEIKIHSKRHLAFKQDFLNIPAAGEKIEMDFQLDPGYCVSGRVVEAETGRPLRGVLVGPRANRINRKLHTKRALYGQPPKGVHTFTDKEGYFTLQGLGMDLQEIWALHPGFVKGVIENIVPGEQGYEFRLEKGLHIHGKAYPGDGPMVVWVDDRPVLTDVEGNFRSFPLQPGKRWKVFVEEDRSPSRSFGQPGPDGVFFHAIRHVEVVDRDVELNFGMAGDAAAWQGTLYSNGVPVENGCIILNNVHRSAEGPTIMHRVKTDASGRFMVNRLARGGYSVNVLLPEPKRKVDGGEIFIESSAAIDKDIRLRGASISGVLRYASSSGPGDAGQLKLDLIHPDSLESSVRAWPGKDGRFYLNALKPGRYELTTAGFRILDIEPHSMLDFKRDPNGRFCFELYEGQQVEDLVFNTSSIGAFIHIAISGFEESDTRKIIHSFKFDGGKSFRGKMKAWEIMGNGTVEELVYTDPMGEDTSRCTMELSAKNLVVERVFEVRPGEVAELKIHRDDFTPITDLISLSGRLEDADGYPVKYARLEFIPPSELSWKNKAGFRCITNADGRFEPDGLFLPGKVAIEVTRGKEQWSLSAVISEDRAVPCELCLVLPRER